MDELKNSINQYYEQLAMVSSALESTSNADDREPLLKLSAELQELINLTEESLNALADKNSPQQELPKNDSTSLDDEYALFKQEIEKSEFENKNNGENKSGCSTEDAQKCIDENRDIQEELSTLLGMKCAVYHTHKWGGQPSLHNAMVSAVETQQSDHQFEDLQVQVLFTHPTHAEMLPCPFYLDGECKFSDEQCRYSHGVSTLLSDLKDAIEPNFETIKVGSRILLKIKPPSDADISLKKKSAEKYHLWHRAVVKSVNFDKKICSVKLEQGFNTGEKRKLRSEEYCVPFEDIFPLINENEDDPESDDSLSDTEYLESKVTRADNDSTAALVTDQVVGPPMGEWERHTRGIGSKLMLAMGYVPGQGLGAAGEGRVTPVQARLLPPGKSLDHCMEISERAAGQDPLKVLAALNFYATGSYQGGVGENDVLHLSQQSTSECLRDVTDALNKPEILRKYIKFPHTQSERDSIARRFNDKFGFPGVIGCIDGTHIAIIKPNNDEEAYYNRKGYHSLNVLMICDADLRILHVDPSFGGASHDSHVWNMSPVSTALRRLHQQGQVYWLLGDSGYAQRPWMMTPILNTEPDSPEANYTYIHVRTRNVVERSFGVLKSRFRCLLAHRTMHYKPRKAAQIVNACVVLHNLINDPNFEIDIDAMRLDAELQPPRLPAEDGRLSTDRQRVVDRLWHNRRRR